MVRWFDGSTVRQHDAAVNVAKPSDRLSITGFCPDPLAPIRGPLELKADFNHAFWVRVFVPTNTPAGLYRGTIELRAKDFHAQVPLQLLMLH